METEAKAEKQSIFEKLRAAWEDLKKPTHVYHYTCTCGRSGIQVTRGDEPKPRICPNCGIITEPVRKEVHEPDIEQHITASFTWLIGAGCALVIGILAIL